MAGSIFLFILLVVNVSWADIFRYVDENGTICYTDAPLNRKAERIIRTESVSFGQETYSVPLYRDYHSIVLDKANKYDLDPSLVHAVIKTESNGNPRAVSPKGAMGLMQLMPATASDLEVRNPFDPEENIDGGTRYLKHLLERFRGDLTLALAAYNAGPKAVEKKGTVPQIPETKQYVKRVLSLYNGRTALPVPPLPHASTVPSGGPKSEPIYKVLSEDGTILFTNSPFYNYKKNPRF